MSDINAISPITLAKLIPITLNAGLVPYIVGSPSTSKSSVVKQYCKKSKKQLIDLRLAQIDSLDLNGLVSVCKEGQSFQHLPLDIFPLSTHTKPKGKDGWVLFLDEITLADTSTQNAAYKIILDKMIGEYALHPDCDVIIAGNKITDNADVNEINTALASRVVHFHMETPNKEVWLSWAYKNNIDTRIVAFIQNAPDMLYTFNPDSTGFTYAAPRTWEFLSRQIKTLSTKQLRELIPLVTGTIGVAEGHQFVTYCESFKDIPTIKEILKNPKSVDAVDEISAIFFIIEGLAEAANSKNIKKVLKYIDKFGMEYRVLFFRSMTIRGVVKLSHKVITKWIKRNKDLIL